MPNKKNAEIVNQQLSEMFKIIEGPNKNIENPAKMKLNTNNNFLETFPNKCSNIKQHPKYPTELTANTYPTQSSERFFFLRTIEMKDS